MRDFASSAIFGIPAEHIGTNNELYQLHDHHVLNIIIIVMKGDRD